MIGSAVTAQFFYFGVMFVVLVLFLYVRYQFRRGRNFLGRMYDITVDGTSHVMKKTSDFVRNK